MFTEAFFLLAISGSAMGDLIVTVLLHPVYVAQRVGILPRKGVVQNVHLGPHKL